MSAIVPREGTGPRSRLLYLTTSCLLDDTNGAAVAGRTLLRGMARRGMAVEALCGPTLDGGGGVEVGDWLAERRVAFEAVEGNGYSVDARGVRAIVPPHLKLVDGGVPITVHRGSTAKRGQAGGNPEEFDRLFEGAIERFRPDVVVGYGGSRGMRRAFAESRRWGIATVFELHNFAYDRRDTFDDIDAVRVPSRFAAEHYRRTLGLECTVLPNLVDVDRVRALDREPKYVTFVNPSAEKGVYPFARIADELGRRRPEIPLLVVESRGSEATLASCGLDLRGFGNVFLMANTADPRRFWRLSKLCLMPSLWRENQPLVAVEAMLNGIPVIGSDRGGIPETLGHAGVVLPLPDRLTPATRTPPTAEEVGPWVEAIIRLWDDPALLDQHRRLALAEAGRWASDILEPRYAAFFEGLIRERSGGAIPG